MEDVRKLLPKDKFDLSTTEELMQLGGKYDKDLRNAYMSLL